MNTYMITRTALRNEEEKYIGYGIAQITGDCIVIIANDISTNREFVREIVNRCNKYDASPEHVMDIIYDSIV